MSLEERVFEHHLKLYKFFDPHRLHQGSVTPWGNTASFSIDKANLNLEFSRDGIRWGLHGYGYTKLLNLARYNFFHINKHNWNNEAFWHHILGTNP